MDVTQSFLRAASDHVPDGAFVRGDMRDLPLRDDTVDGVWASASFLHVPRGDAPATVDEFARVLRDGGVCYLSVKRHERGDHDRGDRHFEYYDADELAVLVAESPLDAELVRTHDNWVQVLARLS